MRKDLRAISCVGVLLIALAGLSFSCNGENGGPAPPKPPPPPKGIVAIVYSDLTRSINEETAVRQKQNIEELYRNLPVDTQFFLSGIDRATNTPNIYRFTPEFPEVKVATDVKKLKDKIAETEKAKQTTELDKLNSSLNSYHTEITKQDGRVSCIANKLNWLLDTIRNTTKDFPQFERRVFFYSDMIEECENSFDGKPLTLQKAATDKEEAKHLQDIQTRIDQNFPQATPNKDPKSTRTKIYIVLTSQDDKQNLPALKTIWSAFFKKLGIEQDDIFWATGNHDFFWTLDHNKPL